MAESAFNNQFQKRKEARSLANSTGQIISDRGYNLTMGLTVAWGLLINVIMCNTCYGIASSINPIAFIIGYFVLCFAGIAIAYKSDNPIISFLGYNMVVIPLGLMLTIVVNTYGGMSSSVVTQAFLDTLVITVVMICLALLFPQFFAKLGGILFGCLIGVLIAGAITMILGINSGLLSLGCAALFAFYIGYDFHRSQQYAKTVDNAIDSAIDIYMDIVLLAINLIQLFGRK